ncbi:MAG: NAD/NADP octopine/nopaline dehydrogenase family protein [Vampirovibrionia bacterium]
MTKKVTILGAGNGGMALSYHLAINNVDVMLWADEQHASALSEIDNAGGIESVDKIVKNDKVLAGKIPGFASLAGTTTSIKEAMEYSDIILMVLPSFAQESVFEQAMPYLRDGHLIMLLPGNFGSLVLPQMMKEAGIDKDVIFMEAMSIPYGCRRVDSNKVYISAIKNYLPVATFPASRTIESIERLDGIFPFQLNTLKNVLEVAFSNVNMVVHPGTATLNMGLIETRNGNFFFYKEGMSNAVGRVLDKIDEERLQIGKKLNLDLLSFTELGYVLYNVQSDSVHDFAVKSPGHNSLAPKSSQDRYIAEDTPYLLVPVSELGQMFGMKCCCIESIINIDNIYNDTDYHQTGRNLKKLGIENKTAGEIINYVNTGCFVEEPQKGVLSLCA